MNLKSTLGSWTPGLYQPAKCFICDCLVELSELKNHLRLECETEWLEYCEQETSSSLDFLSFWKQTNDGFRINLKELCRNFVLIIDEMFLFFKQNADKNWSIGLIDLNEHSVIDVHFSTVQWWLKILFKSCMGLRRRSTSKMLQV
jgi:hypothetical protein